MPEINFETINEFKIHCKEYNITPELQLNAMKHQNNRGEFLHEVSGIYKLGGKLEIKFSVNENSAFKDKLYPRENGYNMAILK